MRLFYLFRFLATSYLWVPVLWYFMTARGLGWTDIMILSAVYSGVVLVAEMPTGALADRIGRRRSMMLGALAMVVACVVAAFAESFAAFAVFEVFAAVSMALCSGADSAYLFDLLAAEGRQHEYPRCEAIASAYHQAGNVMAYLAGGLLGAIDPSLPYLATAAVAAAAFVVALALAERPARARRAETQTRRVRAWAQHMKRAAGDVARSPRLVWVIAYSAVVFVLIRATIYLYQPYLDARGFGIAETGAVFAVVYLVAALTARQGDWLRRAVGERQLLWFLIAALAVSFIALYQIHSQWALILLAVQAVASGLYSPLCKPILNREIPDSSRRATVLSVESIARRGAMIVFAPVAGIYGASAAMMLCGGVGLAGFAILAALSRYCPARGAASSPA